MQMPQRKFKKKKKRKKAQSEQRSDYIIGPGCWGTLIADGRREV